MNKVPTVTELGGLEEGAARMPVKHLFGLLMLSWIALPALLGQSQNPKLSVESNLVLVDSVARDESGQPVLDLKPLRLVSPELLKWSSFGRIVRVLEVDNQRRSRSSAPTLSPLRNMIASESRAERRVRDG